MEADFWFNKWAKREIGFHQPEANRFLVRHLSSLALPAGARVLIPLCGKTRDAAWLLEQGYRVVGIELSETAIAELFEELGRTPQITDAGAFRCYRAADVECYVGDVFALTGAQLGSVDAVYDRAALVALPAPMRERYSRLLREITAQAPQLLISFEYDQAVMPGPPFCVDGAEVGRLYPDCDRQLLERAPLEGGLKGICPADETAWLIR